MIYLYSMLHFVIVHVKRHGLGTLGPRDARRGRGETGAQPRVGSLARGVRLRVLTICVGEREKFVLLIVLRIDLGIAENIWHFPKMLVGRYSDRDTDCIDTLFVMFSSKVSTLESREDNSSMNECTFKACAGLSMLRRVPRFFGKSQPIYRSNDIYIRPPLKIYCIGTPAFLPP